MSEHKLSRRSFFGVAGNTARNSAILLTLPMILSACEQATRERLRGEDLKNLAADEALEYEAIAARIIPSDESPGAREAGVIHFIDTVIGNNREAQHAILQEGLRELQAAAASQHASSNFHSLTESQQDQLLTEIEDSEFFNTLRFLTIAGMFSLPAYGGNREKVGFELLGFVDQHAWQPPFGFYDADYREKGE